MRTLSKASLSLFRDVSVSDRRSLILCVFFCLARVPGLIWTPIVAFICKSKDCSLQRSSCRFLTIVSEEFIDSLVGGGGGGGCSAVSLCEG